VNMSYRREELLGHGFDERLRGVGMDYHTELTACLPLRARGRPILYDPAIAVDHYPAVRQQGEGRGEVTPRGVTDAVHNETLAVLDFLRPSRRPLFLLWAVLVGTRPSPGVLQAVRRMLARETGAVRLLAAAVRGRWLGWRTHRTTVRKGPAGGAA
jgi:hypothetical protein